MKRFKPLYSLSHIYCSPVGLRYSPRPVPLVFVAMRDPDRGGMVPPLDVKDLPCKSLLAARLHRIRSHALFLLGNSSSP